MSLTIQEIGRLKRYLRDLSEEQRGLRSLLTAMEDEHTLYPSSPKPVSMKTLRRLAHEYEDKQILNGQAPSAVPVFRFLERINWTLTGEPLTIADQAAAFLRTENMRYSDDHLRRLAGDYYLYRRFWLDPGSSRFMRSLLRIRRNEAADTYLIREYQNWPEFDIKETSRGYLYPSGQAIIALMNSVQKTTVKFYSITGLSPEHRTSEAAISSFSGNGIAASDVPPHTGYGFHCVRIPSDGPPMSERVKSRTYSFEEMKTKHPQAFIEIHRYEGFRNVDLRPKPPDQS